MREDRWVVVAIVGLIAISLLGVWIFVQGDGDNVVVARVAGDGGVELTGWGWAVLGFVVAVSAK